MFTRVGCVRCSNSSLASNIHEDYWWSDWMKSSSWTRVDLPIWSKHTKARGAKSGSWLVTQWTKLERLASSEASDERVCNRDCNAMRLSPCGRLAVFRLMIVGRDIWLEDDGIEGIVGSFAIEPDDRLLNDMLRCTLVFSLSVSYPSFVFECDVARNSIARTTSAHPKPNRKYPRTKED